MAKHTSVQYLEQGLNDIVNTNKDILETIIRKSEQLLRCVYSLKSNFFSLSLIIKMLYI